MTKTIFNHVENNLFCSIMTKRLLKDRINMTDLHLAEISWQLQP